MISMSKTVDSRVPKKTDKKRRGRPLSQPLVESSQGTRKSSRLKLTQFYFVYQFHGIYDL